MLTNYHTLTYVAGTLRSRLVGSTITGAFSQEKEHLVLVFGDNVEYLIISCEKAFNTLYFRKNFSRARANSADVLPGCLDRTVAEVLMHPRDRVITFRFKSGDRLDMMFFGSKANVVLVDSHDKITDAFKDAKALIGTTLEYRTGEVIYDIDALRLRFAKPQLATLATILKEEFPTLGTTLVKEILNRAGIAPTIGGLRIQEEQIQAIQRSLSSVLQQLAVPKPRVYSSTDDNGGAAVFSIIPLSFLDGWDEKPFDDIHEAIRFFVTRHRVHERTDEEKRSLVGKLSQKLQRARRTIAAVETDLKDSRRADEYQEFGTLLMGHLDQIGQRVVSVELEGTTIPLQKELSPVKNAQRYFEKAKRSRLAQQQATERLKELQAFIAPAERLLTLLEDVKTKEDFKVFVEENADALNEFGIGTKSEEREQIPFRIFTVDGGFEVWVGKSSRNNDELTLKYAKPDDLWFHARGAAGSHTVLKVQSGKGEPGKKAKEQAAGIAAYYSKMKNANMVPVAMTEKKYVRKPKGAAPGSVTIEREKVIFVEPALP